METTAKKRERMNHQTVLLDENNVVADEDEPLKSHSVEIHEELLKLKQTKKTKVRNE